MCAVEKIEIILTVPSIEETAALYERVLGWTGHHDAFDPEGHWAFGSVACGGEGFRGFNLSRAAEGDAWSGDKETNFTAPGKVNDADAVHANVVDSGVAPKDVPEDQLLGVRTFKTRDVSGFQLVFWQEVEKVSIEEVRRRHREAADTRPHAE